LGLLGLSLPLHPENERQTEIAMQNDKTQTWRMGAPSSG
jgi:hypothetical protein